MRTEVDGASQYIVVHTNDRILEQLEKGIVALRTALMQAWGWVLEADENYAVHKAWWISTDVIPDDILPRPGFGVHYSHGFIKEEEVETRAPFLSVHFQGKAFKKGMLPFSVFLKLSTQVYNSAWKIFAPAIQKAAPEISENLIRRALDIPVYEPAFTSLLIEIKEPALDFARVRNKPKNIDADATHENIVRANDSFLRIAEEISIVASSGTNSDSAMSPYIDAIRAMSELLPDEYSFFDSVFIQGRGVDNAQRQLFIDSHAGKRLKSVISEASTYYIRRSGTVVEKSQRSSSFLLKQENFRETTCAVTLVSPAHHKFVSVNIGMTVFVEGRVHIRPRRDLLWVEEIDFIEPHN